MPSPIAGFTFAGTSRGANAADGLRRRNSNPTRAGGATSGAGLHAAL